MSVGKPSRPTFDPRLLDKGFDPSAIEPALYAWWEDAGFFNVGDEGEPFCVMIPPPNITGTLHMGHAFEHTLMDALIRFARMEGRRTLWQMGTDHAGIATQMIVERQLGLKNMDKASLGREKFLDKVWKWRGESGGEICNQLRRMGSSLDWSHECFTMDAGYANAVREAFVRCYEAGHIYRGTRLVNWDPVLCTAISDLEVQYDEQQASLWKIKYPLVDDENAHVTVATTRPETMLGDTAVAVHPKDPRFKHLIGRQVRVPIVERPVPVIADEHVSMEFGTGCLKITPAHDFNDNEIGKRHALAEINIFDRQARLNDQVPVDLQGLDRFEARARVADMLTQRGLLAEREDHSVQIPRGDRSGAVIEPYLTDQWFMRMEALRDRAVDAVATGRVEFVPGHYANLFNAWMREIRDWCISRQLWWGHRIPAWYDNQGEIYVGRSEAEVRAMHSLGDRPLSQDEDVLETWFSSSLWTFATLGWPEPTERLKVFHPTSVRVTGHDIIFFWVARMMMMTLGLVDEVPFRKVHIHGLVRDAQGQKMSKSRGNGLDPLDLVDGIELEGLVAKRTGNLMQPEMAPRIERATRKEYPKGIDAHGTDALRFTFAALASTGRDVRFDLQRVDGYKNFCNKLWNAARFVLMNTESFDVGAKRSKGLAEQWIESRLAARISDWRRTFDEYRFDLLATSLYEFVWHEYCDWYLEAAKPFLWGASEDPTAVAGTQATLLEVLEALLRALHPLMPFVTEALWHPVAQRLGINGETIMLQSYPKSECWTQSTQVERDFQWMQCVVGFVRTMRSERGLPLGDAVNLLLQGSEPALSEAERRLEATQGMIRHLARIEDVERLDQNAPPPPCAFELIGNLKVMVPLEGIMDLDAERERLDKAIGQAEAEAARVEAKLANTKFTERAPPSVVAREERKQAALSSRLVRLREEREAL